MHTFAYWQVLAEPFWVWSPCRGWCWKLCFSGSRMQILIEQCKKQISHHLSKFSLFVLWCFHQLLQGHILVLRSAHCQVVFCLCVPYQTPCQIPLYLGGYFLQQKDCICHLLLTVALWWQTPPVVYFPASGNWSWHLVRILLLSGSALSN